LLDNTFPFSFAAFAASLSGFQILCASDKQVHRADKPSNFAIFSMEYPNLLFVEGFHRKYNKIAERYFGVLTNLLPLLSKIKSRQ
jgi:hypothetical protein